MGKPYSVDLRERIVNYVKQGHSARTAAVVFGVSPSTAVRFAAAYRDGGKIGPKPQGRMPGTVGKLAAHMAFMIGRLQSEPDITLQELADALREDKGVFVHLSSIHRALKRANYSYKKRPDRH